jgi:hypothetical protein
LLEGDKIQNLDEFAESQAGKALLSFLGDDFAGLQTAFIGKVGLSLSGGGFRASLFHIGVLARLAELDMLKHVEAISCVSGGSIVGAHYYLELRKLLKTTLDKDIKQQDYVKLVERVQRSFLKGVQTNIRMRLLAEWTTNLKMIFLPGYTRTQRLGELYEENLYAEIQDGEQNQPRYISELYILPLDNEKDVQFNPRSQNWSLRRPGWVSLRPWSILTSTPITDCVGFTITRRQTSIARFAWAPPSAPRHASPACSSRSN